MAVQGQGVSGIGDLEIITSCYAIYYYYFCILCICYLQGIIIGIIYLFIFYFHTFPFVHLSLVIFTILTRERMDGSGKNAWVNAGYLSWPGIGEKEGVGA